MSVPWTLTTAEREWREALDEATRLGAPWQSSRFAEYLRIIETIRTLEQSADRRAALAPFRADKRNLELLYEGVGQMMQLCLSSRAWERLNPDLLARKLRTVMTGEPLPNPRGRDDRPRDTLVELLSVALFAEAGFNPSVTENEADLEVEGHGFARVIVECKRPTSLGNALAKARQQLWKRSGRGQIPAIPVLAIECALNLPFQRYAARSERELDEAVTSMFDTADRIVRGFNDHPNGRYRIGNMAPLLLFVISGAVLLDEGGKRITIQMFTSVRQCAIRGTPVNPVLARALEFERREGSLLSGFR